MPFDALAAVAVAGIAPKVESATIAAASTTSFLHVPEPLTEAFHRLADGEHAALQWVHDKIYGPSTDAPSVAGTAPAAEIRDQDILAAVPAHARFVTYYSLGCPHCHEFAPVWKDAAAEWKSSGDAAVGQVEWDSKQCYDEDWKPGQDFKECEANDVEGFPTVRFFPPGSNQGVDFDGDRTPAGLLQFVKDHVHDHSDSGAYPQNAAVAAATAGGAAASTAGDEHAAIASNNGSYRFVEYFAAGCPHCKRLSPTWDKAEQMWQKHHPEKENVTPQMVWDKKECYNETWKPGSDHQLCKKEHVGAFPTLRLYKPEGTAGEHIVDYTGPRTPQALNEFLAQQTAKASEVPDAGTAEKHEDAHGSGGNTEEQHSAGAAPSAAAPIPQDEAPAKSKAQPTRDEVSAKGATAPPDQALPQDKLQLAVQTALVPFAPALLLSCLPPAKPRGPRLVAPPLGPQTFI